MRRNLVIIRGQPDMAEQLTRIAIQSKRHWGYPERWIEAWRDELTIEPDEISTYETWVADRSGDIIGFYVLRAGGGDTALLDHLWVAPKEIGGGVGTRLLTHAFERASTLGWRTMRVVSDPNAEEFYLKKGGRRVGIHETMLEGKPRRLPIVAISLA